MNSSSGKSTAVSSSAVAGKNEVITIDLCLSDTDDEHEAAFKSSSSTAAATAAASLKRTSNPGKPKGKSKRPKPGPAVFVNDNDRDVEIIEISDDEDEGGKPSAAASSSSSAYASSTSATSTAGASKSAASGMQVRSVTLSVEGAAMLIASRTMAKEEPTAESRKKVNGDDEVELVEAPSNSGWRQVSATAAASAGAENTGNASSASTSSRTGQPKDDRAYETNAESKVDDDDDEEFELVATKGTNALIDFPHSRENCVQFSFANGDKKAHCDNCYCYVCDIPAKDCKKWGEHCQACHGERRWREERERFKRLGIEAASATAQPAAAAAAATISTATTAPRMAVSVARPSNMWGIIDASAYANRPDLLQYSITALLQKLTSVHPVEVTPPANSGFVTNLRHYQKQSLAFMLDIERSTGPSPFESKLDGVPHRGGFLCDEVGMGKSAVVLALIASNPLPSNEAPTPEQMREQMKLPKKRVLEQERINRVGYWEAKERGLQLSPIKRMKIKASVILTSASLLGQWTNAVTTDMHKIDIILSTSTFDWEGRRGDRFPHLFSAFEFHRVVVDESHLFGKGNSANCYNASKFPSALRWCVTATPCTGSIQELRQQLSFLGSLSDGISDSINSKPHFYKTLDALKPILIRHTKSQRINGSAALALPASSSATTLVTMSASEKRKMGESVMSHLISKYRRSGGEKAFTITKALGLSAGYGCESKLSLLLNDLHALRLKEPNLRAVVFTQSRDTHCEIINAFKHTIFEVLQFSGSTSAKHRDESIRSFQSPSPRPAVFVITMRAGNVGITLTAASRVYLMEPCLDPAVEVQAAGRIHRLGQTKPVHVVRYAFKNSPEHNITKLHQEVVAGRVSITDGHVPPKAIKILSAGI